MPDETRNTIPEIPVRDEMAWVKNLGAQDRANHEKQRTTDIENDRLATIEKLRKYSAFDGLSDEALNFIALDMAVLATDAYENGIQVGKDWRARMDQAELNRMHSFAYHSIQNVAG